jgi:hypothetical protein
MGDTSLWRSSVLLRVPLLFTAAIVYAWLVEVGSRGAAARLASEQSDPARLLRDEVTGQRQAIERCTSALRAGAVQDAAAALREVARHNASMCDAVAGLSRV